jgi:hypothetical protein
MSTLQVENLIGPTSGSNANKVIIPSGQTLYAAGHVIQVQALSRVRISSTVLSSTSTVILNDGGGNFETTITPKFSNSKIVGYVNISGIASVSNANSIAFMIYRNGSFIQTIDSHISYNSDEHGDRCHLSHQFIDEPNSTSTVTYSIYAKPANTGSIIIFDVHVPTPSHPTNNLILQEIAQ